MRKKNSSQLALALLCHGLQIDPSCQLGTNQRKSSKRRAGLGSGLEVVICGEKDIWINAPTQEKFTKQSPYRLISEQSRYYISQGKNYWRVRVPQKPAWYQRKTSSGTLMSRVGVLQGTYLGIYVGKCCSFWRQKPSLACHFCATGINVGVHEESEKTLQDVVETVKTAKAESDITFVHLNCGYQEGKELELLSSFIKKIKRLGLLVGVQCIPFMDVNSYQHLIRLGVDHFSICYEFHHPEYFAHYLPGKDKHIGQRRFFQALEYLAEKMPRGSVSGEIIAGIEPERSTLEAIDYITSLGAFPTVCVFRPLVGSQLQNHPVPSEVSMNHILQYMAKKCMERDIPMGLVPNLEVSLVLTPDDARYLLPRDRFWRLHKRKNNIQKQLAKLYFAYKMNVLSKVPNVVFWS